MSEVVYQGTLTGSDGSVWAVKDARLTLTPVPPPVVIPPTTKPITGTPNTVKIGTASYPLTAVNPSGTTFPGGRGPDQLVAYQNPVTVTVTNPWGAEVPITAGRAGVLVDRMSTQGPGITVAAGSYVLSGHGTARDFLLTNAKANAVVELLTTTNPNPPPVVIPPTAGALPAWVVGGYWQQYTGPHVAAVHSSYNILWAAFALGGGGASMTFAPVVQDDASFLAEVTAAKKRGVLWGISLGGGVPAGSATVLCTESDAQRCFDTLVPIIDKYGFQAVDYDLENGPGGFTGAALLSLSKKLKGKYGNDFIISMVPRPYESFAIGIAAQLHNAGVLDLLMFQFYDANETRDVSFLSSWIPRILDQAKAAGVPYSKMVVGAITYTQYPYGWNSIAAYRSIIANMRSSRGIRGAFIWETSLDQRENWSFAQQIATVAS